MGRCLLLAIAIVGMVQVITHTDAGQANFAKSNRVTTLSDMVAPKHRSRRAVALSDSEKTQLIDKHNSLRREQGASNMKYMVCAQHVFVAVFIIMKTRFRFHNIR